MSNISFLDSSDPVAALKLELAAAQRELKIEAALEKVRSRSLAMKYTNELREIVKTVFDALLQVGFHIKDGAVSVLVFESGSKDHTQWIASPDHDFPTAFKVEFSNHSLVTDIIDAWENGSVGYQKIYPFEEKRAFFEYLFENNPAFKALSLEVKNLLLDSKEYGYSIAFGQHSALMVATNIGSLLSSKEFEVLDRFSKVFDQAYTRFLDLQKAEVQAKEAKIEAALERVRARAMAMQSSQELKEVAHELRTQIGILGLKDLDTCVIHLYEESPDLVHSWAAIKPPESNDEIHEFQETVPKKGLTIIEEALKAYQSKKEDYILVNEGSKMTQWLTFLKKITPDAYNLILESGKQMEPEKLRSYWSCADFPGGSLLMVTTSLPEETFRFILRRFANVFGLAYRRFADLKKAEAQAKEATKQASLDRVRAEISSMRSSSDLDLITPLIFNELTILGVPFIRCGVFVIHEKEEIVEAYLSSPDGKSLGVLRLPYHSNELTSLTVEAWRKNQVYRQHWNKDDFVHWIELMMEHDQIQDKKTYQGTAAPPENLDLHFVPFTQGMLYVGATHSLNDTEIDLVKGLAKAFSIAYSRYEDFVKLEKAKSEIEATLSELKATQSQLIHAEKMASLGELTAGIAHEIQNPLNFVNNFSEVSAELVEEIQDIRHKMQDTRQKTDDEVVEDEILEDIKQNLEKINHHGKRADAIVKGMLEHSRAGSGEKVPTDINTLAEEYLRLSYHGMRAKDKSFSAEFETHFDSNLPKVNVVPQDIGRVLLNIINNAVQATNQPSKGSKPLEGFRPLVSVSTKNFGDKIEISISDNGPGIPDAIKDKIFQPFFTTKPTGQGTGLGLSLSYDIVKVHGGQLTVESKEGMGTSFFIILPIA